MTAHPDFLTAKQAIAMLAELEGEEITHAGFLKSMTRAGVVKDARGRYYKELVLSARARAKDLDKNKAGKAGKPLRQSSLIELKEKHERLKCEKLEAELGRIRAETMPVGDHDRILSELGQEVRQRMEMLPGSLAPLLTGKPTPIIADLLGKAIREALQQLAAKADE